MIHQSRLVQVHNDGIDAEMEMLTCYSANKHVTHDGMATKHGEKKAKECHITHTMNHKWTKKK